MSAWFRKRRRTCGGARVLDLGGIAAARALEMYLPLWLALSRGFGHADFNVGVRRAR